MFVVLLLVALNFGISWGNAYVAGTIWRETMLLGGWAKAVAWSARIQSVCGFTMVFGVLLAFLASALHILSNRALEASLSLTYVMIIFPILGSGFIITAHSWIAAYRNRDWMSYGTAGWNTFAMGYDTYNAISGFGEAFSKIGDFLSSDDDEDDSKSFVMKLAIIIIIIAAASVILAWLLTNHIMRKAMNTLPAPIFQGA